MRSSTASTLLFPLCACLSSGLADGPLGRANVLGSSLGVYGLGLVLLTISSLPFMFSNFPYGPSGLNITLFAISLVLFGAGYGGMKVCTNPMMADSITAMHTSNEQAPLQDEPLNDMEKVRVQEGITDDVGDIPNAQLDLALQSLFRVAYCVSNCGGAGGDLPGTSLA
ncbi:POT family, putative [Angomonas deanei]|uniref:POT family, putative n=1 Tax=Angomonas deanei TaxID=59799 RepID=A0A7G2CFQ2_9TRYP|nr:POT family, putative [Angomonas deanei]